MDQPKERRKQIRWALDGDDNVPVDGRPKGGLTDLPSGTAEIEKKPTELRHTPPSRCAVALETDNKDICVFSSGCVEVTENIKTETQTKSTDDDRERQPHLEKTIQGKIRSLVRRTRSFSKATSGGSPVKLPSPGELSPTKKACQRPCSKSSPKPASHLQRLDHWLVKSCDDMSAKSADSYQDAPSVVESVDRTGDFSQVAMDEGQDVGVGKTDRAIISSFDGNADSNSNETESTSPASLTSSRLPIVELHKLSQNEILHFSPKKADTKQATYEASNIRESKIVHKLRISDESDSDVSVTSDDLFAASHNAAGFEANYVSQNFSEIARCEERKSLVEVVDDKTVSDDGRGFDIGKFTKQEHGDSDHVVIDDHSDKSEGPRSATAVDASAVVDRHSTSTGSELGSRSRQRRPPGWLRDMEYVPLSPRSQDKSTSPAARRQSPLAKKTASAKTIDFSKAGSSCRRRKTSLSLNFSNSVTAVNEGIDLAYEKEDGKDENISDKINSDGEKEKGGADEITTESVRLTRIPLKSFKPKKHKSSVSVQAATEVTSVADEKSLADVNEDTPQSASTSASCDKRSSSKQAKKAGTPLAKRGTIKAKVLDTIFSRRLDAESSDEEDLPLSLFSTSNDSELCAEITDDIPLSQFAHSFRNEKCQSKASHADVESLLTQDSVLTSADVVGGDIDETRSSTNSALGSHLATVEVSDAVVPPTECSTGETQPSQRRRYKKRSAFELLQNQLGIAMVTSPEHKSLRSKGTDILKSRTLSSLEKLRRKRRLALKRKKGSGRNPRTPMSEEAELVSGVSRKDGIATSCVTTDKSTVCEPNESLEKFDREEDCMIVNDSDKREIWQDRNNTTDAPTKRTQSLDSEEISEEIVIVPDKVESPAMSRSSQSATERLKNQLGIKMKTSPVHKCLRSNKSAKLFKTRSHSSLEKIRRKRQHSLTRKRKRESGGDDSRSSSTEAECVTIVSQQDSEAVRSCVTQDVSAVKETTVSSETEQEAESIVKFDCGDVVTVTAVSVLDKEDGDMDHDETTGTSTKHVQSVDSKEAALHRKGSFAMSRASLILHRARLMMRGNNKPSPNNTESASVARDSAKPQLPRCVGILKPPRSGDSDTTETCGQSPPSQFRPVQLPCVYSPSASPSAGILKKQRLSIATPSETPSPKSPSKKVGKRAILILFHIEEAEECSLFNPKTST